MNDPKEIVVFLSYENRQRPRRIAETMLRELEVPCLAVGVDALTSACEVRLYYHEATLQKVRHYLTSHRIDNAITFL